MKKYKWWILILVVVIIAGVGFFFIKDYKNLAASLFTLNSNIRDSFATCSASDSGYTFVKQWDASPNGKLGQVVGIATDPQDNVYVASNKNSTTKRYVIQKFDKNGTYISQFVLSDIDTWSIVGLTSDHFGNIYTFSIIAGPNSGGFDHRITKFDSSGTLVTSWGFNTGMGNSYQPITTDATGNVLVPVPAGSNGWTIQKFSPMGVSLPQITLKGGTLVNVSGITVNKANGNIYIADRSSGKVFVYSSTGNYLSQWTLSNAFSITTNSTGNVFVSTGTDGSSIKGYSPSGGQSLLGTQTVPAGLFIAGLAIDSKNNLYAFNAAENSVVQKFSPCKTLSAIPVVVEKAPVVIGLLPTKQTPTRQIVVNKTISGKVYNDANSNGAFNIGDLALAGVKIDLYKQGQIVPVQTVTTANAPINDSVLGTYTFANVADGTYYVVLNNELNYQTITQPGKSAAIIPGRNHGYTVTIINGQGVASKDFGVIPKPVLP